MIKNGLNQDLLIIVKCDKSHLYLYEDSIIRGRYDYEKSIDLSQEPFDVIRDLCFEFNDALHGRNYYQSEWGTLCEEYEITLDAYC